MARARTNRSVDATATVRATGAANQSVRRVRGGAQGGSNKLFAPGGVRMGNRASTGIASTGGMTPTSGRNSAGVGRRAPGKVVSGTKRTGKGRGSR